MSTPEKYQADLADHEREEWLHDQYVEKGLSMEQIAEKTPVTHGTIQANLDRHGIETRPSPAVEPDAWERQKGQDLEYVGLDDDVDDEIELDWSEVE